MGNKKTIAEDFSFRGFEDERHSSEVFVFCNFVQSDFSQSTWVNCTFIDCDFSLASLSRAKFDKCYFKTSNFTATHFDKAVLSKCHAFHTNFDSSRFDEAHIDFLSSDKCSFDRVNFGPVDFIPAECRELIGEIIRQCSDDHQVIAFSALVKNYKEFCWETLIKIGQSFVSEENRIKIESALCRFNNLKTIFNIKNRGDLWH